MDGVAGVETVFAKLRGRSNLLLEIAGRQVHGCRACQRAMIFEATEARVCSCGGHAFVLLGVADPKSPLAEDVRQVVRQGQVVPVVVRKVKRPMTPAHARGLAKARLAANTPAAKQKRRRSREIGQRKGLY